jgi:large subunit ribosomal protein L21
MIAIIKTGGKQYKVKENEVLKVEKLESKVGDEISFADVLLVSDDEEKDIKVGAPIVEGATVKAKVLEHAKADKVLVVKFKNKVRYRRNVGHRQPFTKVQITSIK